MNHGQHYLNLMNTRKLLIRSKKTGIYEKHHILPRCLGGTNNGNNLILLTPREHFIAHLLLTQMYTGKEKTKMCLAFMRMCSHNSNHDRRISAKQYELAKKLLSENCRGANNPFYGRVGSNRGKHLSEETKEKLRKANLGKISPLKGKKTNRPSWNKGGNISEEHKNKIRKTSSRIIIEYDLFGNKLNEYTGTPEASRMTGLHKTTIYNCCKLKSHYQTKERTFRYKGDLFDYVPYVKVGIGKPVVQKDKMNNIISEYTSVTEASIKTGICGGNISNCCLKKPNNKTAGGFIWEFKI